MNVIRAESGTVQLKKLFAKPAGRKILSSVGLIPGRLPVADAVIAVKKMTGKIKYFILSGLNGGSGYSLSLRIKNTI